MKEFSWLILVLGVVWMLVQIIRSFLWQKRLSGKTNRTYHLFKTPMFWFQGAAISVLAIALLLTNTPQFDDLAQNVNEGAISVISDNIEKFAIASKEVKPKGDENTYDMRAHAEVSNMVLTLTFDELVYIEEGQESLVKDLIDRAPSLVVENALRIRSIAVFTTADSTGKSHILHLFEYRGAYYIQDETINVTYRLLT